jgi:HPt (histidine-containing phosphotransfer) domain-containing protein
MGTLIQTRIFEMKALMRRAGSTGTRETPAIDREVLRAWVADDEAAVDEFLIIFRDSARLEMTRLRDALVEGDLIGFLKAAHRLRGGAISMGARDLARAAGVVEAAAKVGDGPACEAGMANLAIQMERMSAELPDTPAVSTPLD